MARNELTVDVKANLSVDRRTAETCLRLVEIFCNDNGVDIVGHFAENGEVRFDFAHKTAPVISNKTLDAINAIGRGTHREDDPG